MTFVQTLGIVAITMESEREQLQETWPSLGREERRNAMRTLPRIEAEELFLGLSASDQYDLMVDQPWPDRRSWIRLLAPDDAADLIQQFPSEERSQWLNLLDHTSRKEVLALLAYAEDEAGGLMNPRFVRLRPDVSVDVAVRYIRAQARTPIETIHYAYVLDADQRLLGVVSFRDLLLAPPEKPIIEMMSTDLITVPEDMDQEEVGRLFTHAALAALPVVDEEKKMKGIITIDDVVGVVQREATEDIQKLGGSEALDEPYLHVGILGMVRKRGGWLTLLFLGEMLTTTAMGYYKHEIEQAVVLAMFIPLIISSGGNSGSQAATLITRALALGEVRLQDWWRVVFREVWVGVVLGLILGGIGLLRIAFWPARQTLYGEHYLQLGFAVSTSLLGVVLWGTFAGATLPFALRGIGFDPAVASAPLVATMVDVAGVVIYFSVSTLILSGRLL